jgi:hypothetical protein
LSGKIKAAPKLLEGELDKSMQIRSQERGFLREITNARMILDLGERHEKKPAAPKPNP